MSGQKKRVPGLGAVLDWLEQYKFVFPVILVGAVLLLWPGEKRALTVVQENKVDTAVYTESFQLQEMEERLSHTLSKIEGAGEVSVLLTVKNSSRKVLAEDKTFVVREGSSEKSAETVVVSAGSGTESPVLLEQIYPEFQGALVVCSGGDAVNIQLKIVEAVSALTGLGADKICICKGK